MDWAFVLHITLLLYANPICCFHGNSEEPHYTVLSRPKFPSIPWGVLLQIKFKKKRKRRKKGHTLKTWKYDIVYSYTIRMNTSYTGRHLIIRQIYRVLRWPRTHLPRGSLNIGPSAHLTNGAHLPRAPEAQGLKPCAPLGIRNPMTGFLKSPTSFLHARKGTFPEAMESFLGRRMSLQAIVDAADSRSPPSTEVEFVRVCVFTCASVCLYLALRTVVPLRLLVCAARPGFLSYIKVKDLKQNICCRLCRSLCSSFSKAETWISGDACEYRWWQREAWMFLLCVTDLKRNASCRLCVLFVPLFLNPRREFLALLASIGDGNDRHECSCCVYYYCSCSVDFSLLLQGTLSLVPVVYYRCSLLQRDSCFIRKSWS